MSLDQRALLDDFQRCAATESINHIIEQLARPRAFAFVRIDGAVPRNHLPLRAAPARDTFGGCAGIARTESATVPSVIGLEREHDLYRAVPSAAALPLSLFSNAPINRVLDAPLSTGDGEEMEGTQLPTLQVLLRSRRREPDKDAADARDQRSDATAHQSDERAARDTSLSLFMSQGSIQLVVCATFAACGSLVNGAF